MLYIYFQEQFFPE